MKHLYLLLIFFSCALILHAQSASQYFFRQESAVALEDLSSGSSTLLGINKDDETAEAISFPIKFEGKSYNEVYVSTNGLVGLGVAPIEFAFDNYITESLVYPLLVAYGDDLATASDGAVVYKVIGTAPYRKLIIEWKVKKISDVSGSYNKTFQLWLYETSNKIEFVYGKGFINIFNGATIGIAGGAANFESVNIETNTASNVSSVQNWGLWPGEGTAYTFSPTSTELLPITLQNDGTIKNVSCAGSANGSIALGTINGGDGNFSVSWVGPSNFSGVGTTITALVPGSYTYTIVDNSNSKPLTGAIAISEPEAIVLSATATNASCSNGGTISVAANGTYAIKDAFEQDVTNQQSFAPGNYAVTSYKAGGNVGDVCFATPVNLTILEAKAITANVVISPDYTVAGQQQHTIYLGYGPQSVSLTAVGVSGGNPSDNKYSFTWSPSNSLSVANEAGTIASPLSTTTYSVIVSDNSGCSIKKDVTVNVVDVRNGDKILICKNGKQENVFPKNVEQRLEKGALLGPCPAENTQQYVTVESVPMFRDKAQVSAYPNPTSGMVTVYFGSGISGSATVTVINANGAIVEEKQVMVSTENQKLVLDLSGRSRGIYIVRIVSGKGIETMKVVKQ